MHIRFAALLSVAALAGLCGQATAAVSENFDGVTAPALPDGWSAARASGALSTPAPAAKAASHAASGPNAVWFDDIDDAADRTLTSPTYALPASGGRACEAGCAIRSCRGTGR